MAERKPRRKVKPKKYENEILDAEPESAEPESVKSESIESERIEQEIVEQESTESENTEQESIEPKAISPMSSRKLVVCMCMFVVFALLYNVLIMPYADKRFAGPNITTASTLEVTTSETETQTETTTESTTETTREPAAPVTKVYKPKPTKAPVVTVPQTKVMLTVPYVSQNPKYPTGCEAGSATMMLRYYGYNVSIDTMVAAIPRDNLYSETLPDGTKRVYGPSIHQKFVGDPRMTYTSPTPGYGAFAPVVTSAMNSVIKRNGGRHIARNVTGSSVNTLFKYLDEGNPVIVWATSGMKTPKYVNSWYIKTASGDKYFEYPRGTHVIVMIGYDSSRVYFSDPWSAGTRAYSHSAFASKYELLGKQAIIVTKRDPSDTDPTTPTEENTTDETEITTDEEGSENTSGESTSGESSSGESSSGESSSGESSSSESTSRESTSGETTSSEAQS